MGLDMVSYSIKKEDSPITSENNNESVKASFEWRKHAKLHQFMHNYYYEQINEGTIDANPEKPFNCIPLHLPLNIIFALKYLIENDNLPRSDEGFFWGYNEQDESAKEYKEQDLEFCDWAIQETENNNSVYYDCWW